MLTSTTAGKNKFFCRNRIFSHEHPMRNKNISMSTILIIQKDMKTKYVLWTGIFIQFMVPSFAQTEFDSLKRNSQLDTLYQPSSKPTVATEFAELKISGFVQPALYFDN